MSNKQAVPAGDRKEAVRMLVKRLETCSQPVADYSSLIDTISETIHNGKCVCYTGLGQWSDQMV